MAPDIPDAPDPLDERAEAKRIARALRRYSTEFLLLVTPKGELVGTSEAEALGYEATDELGHHIAEHIHPDDLPRVFALIERGRATEGFEETIIARAKRADGTWGTFEATVIDALRDPELEGAVLRVRDVTHTSPIASSEVGPHDRFQSLAEALPLGILSADARGHVVFCNDTVQQILNLPADQLLGHGWEKAVHAEDVTDVASSAGQVLITGLPTQVTFRVQTGLFPRWAHAKFVPLGERGRYNGWIATFEDITDRRRAESRLAHQATHDPLTTLPNRMLLEDRLHQACGRLRRGAASVTVFFIDLDGFKDVNDNHGHAAGDRVLREVANRLLRVIRDVDTVARLGGDEFVIVCEDLPIGEDDALRTRIREALSVPMLVERAQVRVGASVGVARTTDRKLDSNELLARADQDMYRAKQQQRTG